MSLEQSAAALLSIQDLAKLDPEEDLYAAHLSLTLTSIVHRLDHIEAELGLLKESVER